MDTIPKLFYHTVDTFAQRPALIEPVEANAIRRLSFHMLKEKVQQFAGYLQQEQVQPGERIMIWSASRIDWLIAYFSSLLVGMTVVPLDVNSREDFFQRVARATEPRFVVTTRKQYQSLIDPTIPLIDIDALPAAPFDRDALPEMQPDDLAELVFTSGTTGQPKGVMLSHKNIVSNALAALQVVHIQADDRALSILPLSHMFELTIDLAILSKGASIVYARSLSPDTILRLFGTEHATLMVLVPQALQLFMNGIEREVRKQKKEKAFELLHRVAALLPFALRRYLFGMVHKRFGGHFRFFVSGGAYLPPTLGRRWENMGFRVLQGYGTTECSPVVSVNPMNSHNLESVGPPLPGVEVRIADDGEIQVRGDNVTSGYWQNPEATELAFQDGWYCTGDLGYFDDKGDLYIKGRKKNLIVLANGLNVYPEDIENMLHEYTELKDAVVVGLEAEGKNPEVHAVILMDPPDQAKAKAVIQQVNKKLASHQQIKGFTIWPEADFPRTHTLKVKRQDLQAQLESLRKEQKYA
ncbi:long-chain acyl-CoA synthetase [Thermosporothrix hazakensis]|jgi:long-chain acyl-CoA synthetase|uniref:Long-chain acyl-CoA synthetase n=1 Tax=Thermosporothrix hazakensis TaxID=644383 RepID=A0A326TX47_THEHA|nr:AMP-binding protein [Thermosporothrix hazakensis]PZW20819.1 long-chain acyl-CoA synthetase [Thermosporothrix hazakensis]GCE47526.1 hypothetical protein KTH_23950 [Thermosporothrix hazakensis]